MISTSMHHPSLPPTVRPRGRRRRRPASTPVACLLAACTAWVAGCASPPPIEPERALSGVHADGSRPFVNPGRPLLAVEVARGPDTSISRSRQDEALRQVTQRRAVADRPERVEVLKSVQRRARAAVDAPGGDGADWVEDPRRSQALQLRWEGGELLLTRTVEAGDNVATEFEPALLVLPRRLEPGRPFAQRARIVVRPLDRPDRVQAEGEALQETIYEADERLRLPAGEVLTHRVRQVLRMKLGPADITSTSVTWYAPGQGSVAETREEVVRVMGVVTRRDVQSWVRQTPPLEGPSDWSAAPLPAAQ
jgi:hypothetical protein